MAVNRTVADWDKKTRELVKKKAIWKQQARDRGEETSSEDDDDDDEFDEEEGNTEVAGVNWGDLVGEDSLPTQGPFLFHVGGSDSTGMVEPGLPLGSAGARGSAVTHGVPAVYRWMGVDRSEAVPEVLAEGAASMPWPMS